MNLCERTHYERLENGIDVFVLRTQVRDVVVCNIAFPGGEYATYDKRTVADIFSILLPTGTHTKKRAVVREMFEEMGIHVSFDETNTHLVVSLACRPAVFVTAFTLVFEMLCDAHPSSREFTEAVTQLATMYEHVQEETRDQANLALMRALYARGHPHWLPFPKDLRNELQDVTVRDVLDHHRATFSGVGGLVAIVGDVHEKDVATLVRSVCARVPVLRTAPSNIHPERVTSPKEKDIIVSIRDKMNVDTLLAIPLALTRDHAQYQALKVGVSILGESCTSRLFLSLRTKQSLTYGAYASLAGMAEGYAGYLFANVLFPNDVFKRGRVALRNEVAQWAEKGVTQGELSRRKEELVGKHKVGLASTRGLCGAIFSSVLSGRGIEFVDTYPSVVESLTLREVNSAIRSHVRYDLAVTAAAGAIDAEGAPL